MKIVVAVGVVVGVSEIEVEAEVAPLIGSIVKTVLLEILQVLFSAP